ncbi:MAG: hypothetical protein VYA66_05915 [SAR324 cluster bacterium]|nr:hypothetical protein [SAR324 cluster bacterium]
MIRQIILICLVAVFCYYSGANGLTVSKVMYWFDEREITQTVEEVYNKTIEIAEQKKIVDKTTDVIDSL